MGDVGNRYDNFVAERLNWKLKIVFMLEALFESIEQVKQAVMTYCVHRLNIGYLN